MSSGSRLSPREESVLRHIERYQLTFQEIISRLFFDGGDPQRVLSGLVDHKLIEGHKGYGGNRTAYVPAGNGAGAAGPLAEARNLAILSFCFLQGRARVRLSGNEVQAVLPEVPKQSHHVLEWGSACKRLFQIYVPGATQEPAEVVRYARERTLKAADLPQLRPWLDSGAYLTAVIVDNPGRRAQIQARLEEAETNGRPLLSVFDVRVEAVPGRSDLNGALDALA